MGFSYKALALRKSPGAACRKEGSLYVVRDPAGRIVTARSSNSGAWKAAAQKPDRRGNIPPA